MVFVLLGGLIIISELFVLLLGYGYDANTIVDMLREDSPLALATGLTTNILFTLFIILCSHIIGKRLHEHSETEGIDALQIEL